MDADLLLISPSSLSPNGEWVSFSTGDDGCYNIEASRVYKQKIFFLKKEIEDYLNAGKNVFVLLAKKEDYRLSQSVTVDKKVHRYNTEIFTNYNFLPIDIGKKTSALGKHIEFCGNSVFASFHQKFKGNLEYQLYVENLPIGVEKIFIGKDKNKILGAIYKVKNGHLITLPFIKYDEEKFTERKKDGKAYWTNEALKFGKTLVSSIIDIDKSLRSGGDRTPPPAWVDSTEFQLEQEKVLRKNYADKTKKIDELILEKNELSGKIEQEIVLKDLLFEKGKSLENAINTALHILGYKAENFDNGILELDHVITSPEGFRFIGEAEGKDNSAINIDKFRQLTMNIHEDLQREEVAEAAIGILFGNGFRLTKPSERPEQFTDKCIGTAKTTNCVLIRTIDLFLVAKYLKESKDELFAKSCRDVIKNSSGKIVDFPKLPA